MNYKIINGTILKSDPEKLYTLSEDLFVVDGKVYENLPENVKEEELEIVDAAHHLVMPGLINLHTHAYMTVLRNYADDVDFNEWLFKRVMPVEDRLPQEGAYWSSLLACMEMVRTGTTCFNDMHMFRGQSARAAAAASSAVIWASVLMASMAALASSTAAATSSAFSAASMAALPAAIAAASSAF